MLRDGAGGDVCRSGDIIIGRAGEGVPGDDAFVGDLQVGHGLPVRGRLEGECSVLYRKIIGAIQLPAVILQTEDLRRFSVDLHLCVHREALVGLLRIQLHDHADAVSGKQVFAEAQALIAVEDRAFIGPAVPVPGDLDVVRMLTGGLGEGRRHRRQLLIVIIQYRLERELPVRDRERAVIGAVGLPRQRPALALLAAAAYEHLLDHVMLRGNEKDGDLRADGAGIAVIAVDLHAVEAEGGQIAAICFIACQVHGRAGLGDIVIGNGVALLGDVDFVAALRSEAVFIGSGGRVLQLQDPAQVHAGAEEMVLQVCGIAAALSHVVFPGVVSLRVLVGRPVDAVAGQTDGQIAPEEAAGDGVGTDGDLALAAVFAAEGIDLKIVLRFLVDQRPGIVVLGLADGVAAVAGVASLLADKDIIAVDSARDVVPSGGIAVPAQIRGLRKLRQVRHIVVHDLTDGDVPVAVVLGGDRQRIVAGRGVDAPQQLAEVNGAIVRVDAVAAPVFAGVDVIGVCAGVGVPGDDALRGDLHAGKCRQVPCGGRQGHGGQQTQNQRQGQQQGQEASSFLHIRFSFQMVSLRTQKNAARPREDVLRRKRSKDTRTGPSGRRDRPVHDIPAGSPCARS